MMKTPRFVHDTVYGHIPYTGLEEKLLQSRLLNRLQFVSQNALAFFAFPSVSTKRYIHSLGTMHMVSHLFQSAMLNASPKVRERFLDMMDKQISQIIHDESLQIDKDRFEILDETLKGFSIALKGRLGRTYLIVLQALRFAGLVHDLGHLPFSHQSEYALSRLYRTLKQKQTPNKSMRRFCKFYERYTCDGNEALHERLGYAYVDMLFDIEAQERSEKSRDLLRLYRVMLKRILDDYKERDVSYAPLHAFVSSTIDADRLDYINRDQLASAYVVSGSDLMRLAKMAVLIRYRGEFKLSFFTDALYDVEHVLQMRFDLYKKVFSTHRIRLLDTLLEKVIVFLALRAFEHSDKKRIYQSIAMLWEASLRKNPQKQLDLISQLDENWLVSLFKSEYFKIKYQKHHTYHEQFYLKAFEEILFGKRTFYSHWANLSEFYSVLGFTQKERMRFRTKFGKMHRHLQRVLEERLSDTLRKFEHSGVMFAYSVVSIGIGIEEDFVLTDTTKAIPLQEISTIKERLERSLANTVPFFLYSTQKNLDQNLIRSLRAIVFDLFAKEH